MTSLTIQSDATLGRSSLGNPPRRKLLFASVHSILDFSNGASVATLDVLQGLTTHGFECQAFCTAKMDLETEVNFEKMISDLHEPYQVRPSVCGGDRAKILYTRRQQVPITFMRQESTRHNQPSPEEFRMVLRFFQVFLDVYRPDVLLTYGGDPITQGMSAVARRRGIPVVFAIHNFSYTDVRHFAAADYCIVPSEFACWHYRHTLGLDQCRVLPNQVDWDRVRVDDAEPRYVTFVNPTLYKGAYPFVRIAQELGHRRPDIPLLVVESRGTKATLGACGLTPSDHPNIQIMPVTTDPRRFWRQTKVVLMPSLCWENQPLVAVEAMINGVPVIGSNRGGTPETLGDAGVLLPLPERLTPESQNLPTAEEVAPWVESIIHLWDDQDWYREQSNRARGQAERWHPDRLRPLYAEFFGDVCARGGQAMDQARLNHAAGAAGTKSVHNGVR
jgi:glycosyltransferase involved in cell wall biosynthesis